MNILRNNLFLEKDLAAVPQLTTVQSVRKLGQPWTNSLKNSQIRSKKKLFFCTQKNFFEILLNQTEIILYLQFSD